MNIHLSTATVQSHENRSTPKSMNLSFHPVVFFENSWPFPNSDLKEMSWKIVAEPIGSYLFDIELSDDSPFEIKNDRRYIEFHLVKKEVPFQHEDYPCQIIFKAVIDSAHKYPVAIEKHFFGVVKTIWSKGLV